METVVAFNNELTGLYESKPPISKAKMAAITRSAMKAIKFYKHVVQSVEKFIMKCKPEYKIPGLYVIDSIVRQSRHQFGAEKDVFAPRFARNMQHTFANLFRCASDDKSRIIRVLNLWQKNNVFAPGVIQPLFDLADPNNQHPVTDGPLNGAIPHESSPVQSAVDDLAMSGEFSGSMLPQTNSQLDGNTLRQLQHLKQMLIRQTATTASNEPTSSGSGAQSAQDTVKFNKKLLDYDYGDEEEDDKTQSPHVTSVLEGNNLSQILNDPNILRQLQKLQKLQQQEEKKTKLIELHKREEAFEKHLRTVLKKLPFANECDLSHSVPQMEGQQVPFGLQQGNSNNNTVTSSSNNSTTALLAAMQSMGGDIHHMHHLNNSGGTSGPLEPEVEFISNEDGTKTEVINLDGNDSRHSSVEHDRYGGKRRRSRSRSRDRRDRRRRSRSRTSRSRSRSPRSSRRRSRDRDRAKEKERDKEREKEREYERERRRKGLPDIKKDHLSVCSTTLWVGHLSKLVQQEELSDTFGKYGDIVSIDMIHPRGCAFIVMNRRQDAFKAMNNLKNHKLQSRAITISWAAGKGVKSKEWKDYWELELGVSYVPWSKITPNTDCEALEEGGMFDEDSMPDWLKDKLKDAEQKKEAASTTPSASLQMLPMPTMFQQLSELASGGNRVDTSQPPPGPPQVPPQGAPPSLMAGVPMTVPPGFPMGPRLMPPMGIPMPGGMVPGLPMGVPPPQMMMAGGGMGIPGLPPIPPPPMDKPPPGVHGGGHPPDFMGMGQFPPVPPAAGSNDDHMDIEMEDDNAPSGKLNPTQQPPPPMYNRPPPHQMFPNMPPGMPSLLPPPPQQMPDMQMPNSNNSHNDRGNDERRDRFKDRNDRGGDFRDDRNSRGRGRDRDRDRGAAGGDRADGGRRNDFRDRNSRWTDRGRSRSRDRRDNTSRERGDNKPLQDRLRDIAGDARGDFTRRGDAPMAQPMWRGGPGGAPPGDPPSLIDMPPMQLISPGGPGPVHGRHNDFGEFNNRMEEFGERRGPREFFNQNRFGPRGGGGNGNMNAGGGGNGGPPFGPRMGIPSPMFIRNARPNQQGQPGQAGFNPFYNDRGDSFEREERSMRGGSGGRSNNPSNSNNRRGGNNWRDNERGGRFQSRDRSNSAGRFSDRGSDRRDNRSQDRKSNDGGKHGPAKMAPSSEILLQQTEPIDDDSQEEFADFDDAQPKQRASETPPTGEGNTTPLYDEEPHRDSNTENGSTAGGGEPNNENNVSSFVHSSNSQNNDYQKEKDEQEEEDNHSFNQSSEQNVEAQSPPSQHSQPIQIDEERQPDQCHEQSATTHHDEPEPETAAAQPSSPAAVAVEAAPAND